MAASSAPRRRLRRAAGVALVVLVLVVAGGVAWRTGVLDGVRDRLGPTSSSAPPDPAVVPPPSGLDLPTPPSPAPVADPITADPTGESTGSSQLSASAIRKALAGPLRDRRLGRHVRAVVAPLDGGAPAVDLGQGSFTPASTTKLVTSSAALLALGSQHRFTTSVTLDKTAGQRRVVLVGGGDPFLERTPDDPALAGVPVHADLETLASRTALRLRAQHVRRVSLGYDDSLFSGPDVSPDWSGTYLPEGVVAPISALWVDEGRPASRIGRVAAPAPAAAEAFAAELADHGIAVTGSPARTTGNHGTTLASMTSAPLAQIVERTLQVSDNEAAEVMLRQVGLARGGRGSFDASRRAVTSLLTAQGVTFGSGGDRTVLHDGSGLARDDTMDPRTLVDVLRLAASPEHPELRAVLTGLPVAGFDGSLAERFDDGPRAALGRVRAKTGTLTGVTSLAGIAVDLDDVPMVFVLMADRVPDGQDLLARVAQDDAAAALGACHCSAGRRTPG